MRAELRGLLRPLVYLCGLLGVFLMLASSVTVDLPWLARDIIDPVSREGQGGRPGSPRVLTRCQF